MAEPHEIWSATMSFCMKSLLACINIATVAEASCKNGTVKVIEGHTRATSFGMILLLEPPVWFETHTALQSCIAGDKPLQRSAHLDSDTQLFNMQRQICVVPRGTQQPRGPDA